MSAGMLGERLLKATRHISLSLCFGFSLIVLVWTITVSRIDVEGEEAQHAVERMTENLARVFEQNVIGTLSEVDKSLQFMAAIYSKSERLSDLEETVTLPFLYSEAMLQLSVIDPQGLVMASNAALNGRSIDVSDREHFRVHRDGQVDGLFISKPVLGRASGKWSVQLTRALRTGDGKFAGVVVASLDPFQISRFYNSIDIGPHGTIALIGDDGVIRAGGIHQDTSPGRDLGSEPFVKGMKSAPAGTIKLAGTHDTPDRILSFRRVGTYPLIVTVAMERPKLSFGPAGSMSVYVIGSTALTIAVLVSIFVSFRHSQRIETARQSLIDSEAQLRSRSRELQLTLDNMTQGLLMVGGDGKVAVANARVAELLDMPPEMLAKGCTFEELIAHLMERGEYDDPAKLPFEVRSHLRGEIGTILPVFERERPDGTVLEVRTTELPDGGFVRTFTDVTERRRSEARIVHLARHDALTSLANRTVFRQELEAAIRKPALGFAIHCIDLDRFKHVNDTAGHPVGDRLLQMVAKRLQVNLREGDVASRLGGDEFAIIQMGVTEPEVAGALAARLCRKLSEPYEIDGKTIFIGASVGVAIANGDDADAMLKAADLALYAAKSEGRGTYRFFDPEMNAKFDQRRQLEECLRQALPLDQFDVHYQPKIDVVSRQITGFEALLRWRHPERGFIPPSEFVPIAEELGLIVDIGVWVIERACADIARLPGREGVAVNLSSAQFRTGDIVATVSEALERSGLPAARLELEITESLLLDHNESTIEKLHALRALGVRISMDDFGTGYSSLSYLLSFPFDRIKIDRAFVRQLANRGPSAAIIRAIVGLARSLGIATTAEGVEAEEELVALRNLGCSEAQGYAFGRPAPAAVAFAPLLAAVEPGSPRVAGAAAA